MTDLRAQYDELCAVFLSPCAIKVEEFFRNALSGTQRIDRISCRVKAADRFVAKAEKEVDGKRKYTVPLLEVHDVIGVRVCVLFLSDVDGVVQRIKNYFRFIEATSLSPDKSTEFGYFGWHATCLIPDECKPETNLSSTPKYFEVQVKTVFQHAWSEVEHHLGYKPMMGKLEVSDERLIAFAASLAWGADNAFQEVVTNRSKSESKMN